MDAESQLLAEKDAEIERLKKEVAHWIDMASQADTFVHRYQRENQELLSEIKRLKELIIEVIKMLKEVE